MVREKTQKQNKNETQLLTCTIGATISRQAARKGEIRRDGTNNFRISPS